MTWLAKDWSSATDVQQATWLPLAEQLGRSPYHAFIAHNLQRLQALPGRYTALHHYGFFPTRYYDTPITGAPDSVTSVSTTGRVLSFTHRILVNTIHHGWFYSWHLFIPGTSGITYTNTIHVSNKLTTGYHDILIKNIPAGFHEFVFGPVNYWSVPRVNYFKRSVTVLP